MGAFGLLFLNEEDNNRISAIAKEKGVDRDVVEVEYKEFLKRIEASKNEA